MGSNIYQRLNEVRKQVDYLRKEKKVEGYKAITHDQVTSEVRQYLIKHGIMIVPGMTHGELKDTGKTTKGGTPITAYVATFDICFVNIDDPQDYVTVTVPAIGEDHGDKGPGKATSYATKTAILKLLSIETGESDESRQEQKPKYLNADQVIVINDLIKEVKANKVKFLEWLKAPSVEKIPEHLYDKAVAALEGKKKNGNN